MGFEKLSDQELSTIALWGLRGNYESSSCQEEQDPIDCAVQDFKEFIVTPWPEGLGNIPQNPIVYRFIRIKQKEKINESELGISWFANPNQHKKKEFWDMLGHISPKEVRLSGDRLLLLKAKINFDEIDIPSTLWERSTQFNENEIVLKKTAKPQLLDIKDYFQIHEIVRPPNNMKEIRTIIRNIVSERFGFNNNKTYNVPMDVKTTASRAISSGKQTSNGGNEGSGKRKAQELSQGTPQTHAQMKRLKAFFDANQPGSPEWELHGGDAAKRWVDSSLSNTHDDNMRTKENMRKLGGGGYGMNDGMGSMSATMMKTNNTRNHSVWTRAKNRMQEAVVDKDGNLIGFSFNEEDAEEFHAQWDMWLQQQAGEVVNGFVLTSDGLTVEWIGENDDYVIQADIFPYPDYESKMVLQLYKEDQAHYSKEISVDKDLMYDNGPSRVWETYKNNLANFIDEAKRQGKFLDI